MIAAAAFSALGLVVIVAAWSRFAPRQAQRRSVEHHQHALGVLGEVAKRRDGVAPVHAPAPQDVARPHVRSTEGTTPQFHLTSPDEIQARLAQPRLVLRSAPTPLRLPIFGEVGPGPDENGGPAERRAEPVVHFEDAGVEAGEPLVHFKDLPLESSAPTDVQVGAPAEPGPRSIETSLPIGLDAARRAAGERHATRRAASVAAALIALAAIGVGTWQVAEGRSPTSPQVQPPAKSVHTTVGGHHATVAPGALHLIAPLTETKAVVTFPLTNAAFTLSFQAAEPCWIGVRQGINGPYLWMTTLASGATASYHATGPVYVRIGAPQYLQVKDDGVRLGLPAKVVQPYDITFASAGQVSA